MLARRALSSSSYCLKWLGVKPRPFIPEQAGRKEEIKYYFHKGKELEVLGKSPIKNFKAEQRELLKNKKFKGGKKAVEKHISQLWAEKSHEEKLKYKNGRYPGLLVVLNELRERENVNPKLRLWNESEKEPPAISLASDLDTEAQTTNDSSSDRSPGFEAFKAECLVEDPSLDEAQIEENYLYLSDASKELYEDIANNL